MHGLRRYRGTEAVYDGIGSRSYASIKKSTHRFSENQVRSLSGLDRPAVDQIEMMRPNDMSLQ